MPEPAPTNPNDMVNTPDRHAFVMLGEQTLFLCHLTMMVHENHRYQLILEASLEPPEVWSQFLKDRAQHPEEMYFIANKADDLMTNPDIARGARKGFKATIWRGIPKQHNYKDWPWTNWPVLIDNVNLNIHRVVYYRHFDFQLRDPASLTYVLFGKGKEAYLHNFQVGEPAFDHVVSLAEPPEWLPSPHLEAGIHVNFPLPARPGGEPNIYCSNPLKESTYLVMYCGLPGPLYEIKIGQSHWFSTAVVNLGNNPCPE